MTIKRISGRALQALRLRLWTENPKCAMCGKVTVYPSGFELDHKVALINGGTNEDSNLEILCPSPCHELKTDKDLGHTSKQQIGLDGWPCERTESQAKHARWRRAEKGKR